MWTDETKAQFFARMEKNLARREAAIGQLDRKLYADLGRAQVAPTLTLNQPPTITPTPMPNP